MAGLHMNPAVAQADCALQQQPHAARQEHMLLHQHPLCERLLGVICAHWNHALADDGAAIDLMRNEVHRRPVNAHAAGQRLAVSGQSRKRRQQRWMDVDQPPRVMRHEALRQYPHETSQYDERWLMRIDRLHQCHVKRIARRKRAVFEHLRGHARGFGPGQPGRARSITDHGGDTGIERLGPALRASRSEQRFQVASAPGDQADDVLHKAAHSTQGGAFPRKIKEFPRRPERLRPYNRAPFARLRMKIFRGLPAVPARVPVALTIGNFDGVHRGHQALLAQVVTVARARGLAPAVMTFEPHPREFFTPEQAPARISNLRDKIDALAAAGIECVFIQHFNRRFAQLSADAFIEQVLVDGCRARWLMIGDDFRFGARRAGDVGLLRTHARAGGYEVVQSHTVCDDGERISSSAVRSALAAGDLPLAQQLLGRPYAISSRVQHGAKLGRSLGFPTLNLRIAHARKMRRPALHGVFAVRIHGLGQTPRSGVASMGLRPTVDDSGRWLLEVHVFDFSEQVYGRLVRVEFIRKLRDEVRYDTLAELTHAIGRDADHARALLSSADEAPASSAQATI